MAIVSVLTVNANALAAADYLWNAEYALATSVDNDYADCRTKPYSATEKALIAVLTEIVGNKADAMAVRDACVETSEYPSAQIGKVLGYRVTETPNETN